VADGTSLLNIIQMLKFPVMKLFTSNFTMEMISSSMLLTKKLLDQRKKNWSSF